MCQQYLRFRCEQQGVIKNAPVEGFLSKPIACNEEPALSLVPQRKGKHTVEMFNHCIAVFFVEMWQNFGLRSTAKRMSALLRVSAKLAVVIDLSVEDDND